jgi:DNA-binding XRE family transcriptional regulator
MLGWSQHKLAKRAGVSRTSVKDIETGFRDTISDYMARRLTKAFRKAGVRFIPRGVKLK